MPIVRMASRPMRALARTAIASANGMAIHHGHARPKFIVFTPRMAIMCLRRQSDITTSVARSTSYIGHTPVGWQGTTAEMVT